MANAKEFANVAEAAYQSANASTTKLNNPGASVPLKPPSDSSQTVKLPGGTTPGGSTPGGNVVKIGGNQPTNPTGKIVAKPQPKPAPQPVRDGDNTGTPKPDPGVPNPFKDINNPGKPTPDPGVPKPRIQQQDVIGPNVPQPDPGVPNPFKNNPNEPTSSVYGQTSVNLDSSKPTSDLQYPTDMSKIPSELIPAQVKDGSMSWNQWVNLMQKNPAAPWNIKFAQWQNSQSQGSAIQSATPIGGYDSSPQAIRDSNGNLKTGPDTSGIQQKEVGPQAPQPQRIQQDVVGPQAPQPQRGPFTPDGEPVGTQHGQPYYHDANGNYVSADGYLIEGPGALANQAGSNTSQIQQNEGGLPPDIQRAMENGTYGQYTDANGNIQQGFGALANGADTNRDGLIQQYETAYQNANSRFANDRSNVEINGNTPNPFVNSYNQPAEIGGNMPNPFRSDSPAIQQAEMAYQSANTRGAISASTPSRSSAIESTPKYGTGSAADMMSNAGQEWLNSDAADQAYAGVTNPQAAEGWQNGNKTTWGDGMTTVYDGKGNLMGYIDSAGNTHPASYDDGYHWVDPQNLAEAQEYQNTWLDLTKSQMEASGHQFDGDGSEWDEVYSPDAQGTGEREDWTGGRGDGFGPWTKTHDRDELMQKYVADVYGPDTVLVTDDMLKDGVQLEPGQSYVLEQDILSQNRWRMQEARQRRLNGESNWQGFNVVQLPGAGGSGGNTGLGDIGNSGVSQTLSDLMQQIQDSNDSAPKSIEELNQMIDEYGTDYDALRQRLQEEYGTTDLSMIGEALKQAPGAPELNFEESDKYRQAEEAYNQAIGNKTTLEYEDADRSGEEYNPNDYTQQINDIYDKNLQSAVTQIQNQLQQGELDIDRAIEKVPQIYEAGMNDMATQFEINQRNANEYFNANGLSSGAKAQAALAMNNAYQKNMSAYRMEQANAIQEYEDKRTDLRMSTQAAITEALLENDSQRAQAMLAEYQRQDQQSFQVFMQKMENDYKYYALEIQKATQKAAFEEEQRQNDIAANMQLMNQEIDKQYKQNQMKLQLAQYAQDQWKFTVQTGLDIAKIEETIRQNNIDTELSIAQLAQRDGEFKVNAKMNIAELAEKMRQFGIDTNITLAKLAEQQREFNINTSMSQAELQEKIRQFNANLQMQQNELDLKKYQIDTGNELDWAKLTENARQANMDYEAAMAKLGKTGDNTPTGFVPSSADVATIRDFITEFNQLSGRNDGRNVEVQGLEEALTENAANFVNSFLTDERVAQGWTMDLLKAYLQQYGLKV